MSSGGVSSDDFPRLSSSLFPPPKFYQGEERKPTKGENTFTLDVNLNEWEAEVFIVFRRPVGGFSVNRQKVTARASDHKLRAAATKVRRALLKELEQYG